MRKKVQVYSNAAEQYRPPKADLPTVLVEARRRVALLEGATSSLRPFYHWGVANRPALLGNG
jgi:hypothetical protein